MYKGCGFCESGVCDNLFEFGENLVAEGRIIGDSLIVALKLKNNDGLYVDGEHTMVALNFCPYCGRPLNREEANWWHIERAKAPIYELVDKAITNASIKHNLAIWAKSHLIDVIEKEGFTPSDAEKALEGMIHDDILERVVVDNNTYLTPIA